MASLERDDEDTVPLQCPHVIHSCSVGHGHLSILPMIILLFSREKGKEERKWTTVSSLFKLDPQTVIKTKFTIFLFS